MVNVYLHVLSTMTVPPLIILPKLTTILLRVRVIFTDPIFVASLIYAPIGDYHLMNDRITSSDQTPRSSRFRQDVMARDGPACVFTRFDDSVCDAAHLLPRSKGDEVCIRPYHCSVSPPF